MRNRPSPPLSWRAWRFCCLFTVACCFGSQVADAQALPASTTSAAACSPAPDRGRRLVRYGSIAMALAGASGAVATGLLSTQAADSWGEGIGIGHALMGASYFYDGITRLAYARRIRREGGTITHTTPWVLYFNAIVTGAACAAGVVATSLGIARDDPTTSGVGVTLMAHTGWLFAFNVRSLRMQRRREFPWMVFSPRGVRF